MTTININRKAFPHCMSQSTLVGPEDGRLVVTKDDDGGCWIERELLIASDHWVEVAEMA
jgi:hypothetical protein